MTTELHDPAPDGEHDHTHDDLEADIAEKTDEAVTAATVTANKPPEDPTKGPDTGMVMHRTGSEPEKPIESFEELIAAASSDKPLDEIFTVEERLMACTCLPLAGSVHDADCLHHQRASVVRIAAVHVADVLEAQAAQADADAKTKKAEAKALTTSAASGDNGEGDDEKTPPKQPAHHASHPSHHRR